MENIKFEINKAIRAIRIELTFSSGKFIAYRSIKIKDSGETLHLYVVPLDAETIRKEEIGVVHVKKSKLDFMEEVNKLSDFIEVTD